MSRYIVEGDGFTSVNDGGEWSSPPGETGAPELRLRYKSIEQARAEGRRAACEAIAERIRERIDEYAQIGNSTAIRRALEEQMKEVSAFGQSGKWPCR